MNLLSSTSVFSFYTLLSRVLGYLRDILIAFFLGTSIYADAFFVAFRLPNTFRRLFAEGTFNAAFIPSYAEEKIKGKKVGKKFESLFTTIKKCFINYPLLIFSKTSKLTRNTFWISGFWNSVDKFPVISSFEEVCCI